MVERPFSASSPPGGASGNDGRGARTLRSCSTSRLRASPINGPTPLTLPAVGWSVAGSALIG
eukprot:11678637-Alexandrium_andersonii.AAC.1